MTKKSFLKITAFGISILFISIAVCVFMFYSHYEKQAMASLGNTAAIVAEQLNSNNDYSFISNGDYGIRLTVISADGTVLAESSDAANAPDKHDDRPEFRQALENGTASSVRYSSTLNENTYYYAIRLENGSVLRACVTSDSVFAVFYDSLLILAVIVLIIILTSLAVSIAITKSIVKPIIRLGESFDHIDSINTYTELQPFIDTIKAQKRKQKQLDKQKKEFTANVSHELKTPLTSIAGYAELIENGIAKEEDIKPFAHTIRSQALRLVNLSEDIIQLSQLEESENEIVFEDLDLNGIAVKCTAALEMNAKTKEVTLSVNNEQCIMKGNKALLEELIYNLIDNAIRYNKSGGSVEICTQSTDNGTLLSVTDTGIGIPEKYNERVFERFFRVDKSRSKQTGGTGLGLAIVKHIAEVHGAQIRVHSKEGDGTRIEVLFGI